MNETLDTHLQELRRGTVVLACLQLLRTPEYGYALLEQLESRGFATDANTLYPLLSKMRREELVDYEWKESESGPPRKYYELTAKGRAQLRETMEFWQQINETVKKLGK